MRWELPESAGGNIMKRASGYSPEYKDCGNGNSCAVCGGGYEECPALNSLALFCFNSAAGQVCCPNGQGSKFICLNLNPMY